MPGLSVIRHKMVLHCRSDISVKGSVFLEFLICLPLLFLLISIVVDLWVVIRQADALLVASQHGARAAGAQAHELSLAGNKTDACSDGTTTSTVLTTGVSLAHSYLNALGLYSAACVPSSSPVRTCSNGAITIKAEFYVPCEDNFKQNSVKVTVAATSAPPCVFCLLPLPNVGLSAASIYPAELDCTVLGALTCSS